MPVKSLYVGNLAYEVTEDELRDLFLQWGPLGEVRVISNRGFGFVEVPQERAAEAIAALNGKDHRGRNLMVNEARPRTEHRPGGGGGPRRGGRGGRW